MCHDLFRIALITCPDDLYLQHLTECFDLTDAKVMCLKKRMHQIPVIAPPMHSSLMSGWLLCSCELRSDNYIMHLDCGKETNMIMVHKMTCEKTPTKSENILAQNPGKDDKQPITETLEIIITITLICALIHTRHERSDKSLKYMSPILHTYKRSFPYHFNLYSFQDVICYTEFTIVI